MNDNDMDWNIVSHEETLGYHKDRILLLLGPKEEVYNLLLADVPQTSVLLVQTGCLPPQERCIRLPILNVSSITAYIDLHCGALPSIESSWDDLIKLAITSEELQDLTTHSRIIETLTKKAKAAECLDVHLLRNHEYQIAQRYRTTGKGARLLQVVRDVLEKFHDDWRAPKVHDDGPQTGELNEGQEAVPEASSRERIDEGEVDRIYMKYAKKLLLMPER
jgi:hypothetical protein